MVMLAAAGKMVEVKVNTECLLFLEDWPKEDRPGISNFYGVIA